MDTYACPLSRRSVTLGLASLIGPLVAGSRSLARPDAPPLLLTSSSQFIEIEPAVEMPALRLDRIDGKSVLLTSFRGKAVLVCFWATWCPPCRRELPSLARLRDIVDPRSLEIVAVSIDTTDRPAIDAYLKRLNVTRLRPYLDPVGRIAKPTGGEAATPFVLYGMPISYVIDLHGRISGYITGEVDWTSADARALLEYYMSA